MVVSSDPSLFSLLFSPRPHDVIQLNLCLTYFLDGNWVWLARNGEVSCFVGGSCYYWHISSVGRLHLDHDSLATLLMVNRLGFLFVFFFSLFRACSIGALFLGNIGPLWQFNHDLCVDVLISTWRRFGVLSMLVCYNLGCDPLDRMFKLWVRYCHTAFSFSAQPDIEVQLLVATYCVVVFAEMHEYFPSWWY